MHAMLQPENAQTQAPPDLPFDQPAAHSHALPGHSLALGAAKARSVNTPSAALENDLPPLATAARAEVTGLDLPTAYLEAMLHSVDVAMMICTQHGQVRFMNEAARRAMSKAAFVSVDGFGQLVVRVGRDGGAALMSALARSAQDKRHQMLSLGVGASAVKVAVQPLAVACEGEPSLVLLVFSRIEAAPDLAFQLMTHQHGLTPTEVQVLEALLAGKGVPAIAQDREVQVCTVRAQVGAIRAKLGLQRVGQIMRMVADLPPVITALRKG